MAPYCNVCGNHKYFVVDGVVVNAEIAVRDEAVVVVMNEGDVKMEIERMLNDDSEGMNMHCVCGNDFLIPYEDNWRTRWKHI